jgi:hypothetical protein
VCQCDISNVVVPVYHSSGKLRIAPNEIATLILPTPTATCFVGADPAHAGVLSASTTIGMDVPASQYARVIVELTRFRGRLTRPKFGAEVAHEVEQERRNSTA